MEDIDLRLPFFDKNIESEKYISLENLEIKKKNGINVLKIITKPSTYILGMTNEFFSWLRWIELMFLFLD